MEKNICISLISLIAVIIVFAIIWTNRINNEDNELINNEVEQNSVNVSDTKVDDDCINEWNDYDGNYINNEDAKDANSNLVEENIQYIVKKVQNYIYVYYLYDNNEEYLYKKTSISTDYLSDEDINNLEIGIEVTGIENVNKLLEDFE